MNKQEIPFLSATELAGLIQAREVSPVEATEAYLDRIAEVDGKLNSYITVTREEALAEARHAEAEIAAGNYRGPMHGIPVAVKDQLNTRASAPRAAPPSWPTTFPTRMPRQSRSCGKRVPCCWAS